MKKNVHIIANICLFFSLLFFWFAGKTIATGKDFPADPDTRLGFLAGLLLPPTLLLIVAVALFMRGSKRNHGC